MKHRKEFNWQEHPVSEQILTTFLRQMEKNNKTLHNFSKKLTKVTNTRLFDWIDHFILSDTLDNQIMLKDAGFYQRKYPQTHIYSNNEAQLPDILLIAEKKQSQGVAILVEDITCFLSINCFTVSLSGSPLSKLRKCLLSKENNVSFWAIERRGGVGFLPVIHKHNFERQYYEATYHWINIPRSNHDENFVFYKLFSAIKNMIALVGKDISASIVCQCERTYWMSRNYTGRIQKMRQDILGLGWANHDHHTFRSSRSNFRNLINLFKMLGFNERERFYAGKDAGWGAQVMENQKAGLTLFLDVDLNHDEIDIEFNKIQLKESEDLGTVGLWCALHGDSILKAGLHHLAALSLFDNLMQDLNNNGIVFLKPFSNFPFLKQAFSTSEIWEVDQSRINKLTKNNQISSEQAIKFRDHGGIGSVFENIQRRKGFKGFNKTKVSNIIKRIDPRNIEK